jgi:RES domain-containing protein
VIAWRVTRAAHEPWDATGAMKLGARWNSPGRPVIYAADTFAGAILEILAHALRPRTLPGPQHASRNAIPDRLVESVDDDEIAGWETEDSVVALRLGDEWLASGRTPILVVPALPSRPIGRTVLINPLHERAAEIQRSEPFLVPWDDRLF